MTVLNQFEETIYSPGWNSAILICLIAAIIFAVITFLAIYKEEGFGPISMFLALLTFSFVIVSGILYQGGHEEIETRYEVILDDSTSLKDFMQKYNIVEQRGEIYIITEKGEDAN